MIRNTALFATLFVGILLTIGSGVDSAMEPVEQPAAEEHRNGDHESKPDSVPDFSKFTEIQYQGAELLLGEWHFGYMVDGMVGEKRLVFDELTVGEYGIGKEKMIVLGADEDGVDMIGIFSADEMKYMVIESQEETIYTEALIFPVDVDSPDYVQGCYHVADENGDLSECWLMSGLRSE